GPDDEEEAVERSGLLRRGQTADDPEQPEAAGDDPGGDRALAVPRGRDEESDADRDQDQTPDDVLVHDVPSSQRSIDSTGPRVTTQHPAPVVASRRTMSQKTA